MTSNAVEIQRYEFESPQALRRATLARIEAHRSVFEAGLRMHLRRLLRVPLSVEVGPAFLERSHQLTSFADGQGWWCSGGAEADDRQGAFLGISPGLVYGFIDRRFGGEGELAVPERTPSDIETRHGGEFLQTLFQGIAEILQEPPLRLVMHVSTPLDEPLSVFLQNPQETLVHLPVRVELRGSEQQELVVCLRRELVERAVPTTAPSEHPAATSMGASLQQARMVLQAELACCRLSLDEVRQFGVGDVVVFQKQPDQPLDVTVQGRRRFRARLGTRHGHYAVEVVPEQPDDESSVDTEKENA